MVSSVIVQFGVLNSATLGCELAAQVLEQLSLGASVHIRATDVSRVTPSFANAFVMTVLERFPDAFASHRCTIEADAWVDDAFVASMDRYARGIRLSGQRAICC